MTKPTLVGVRTKHRRITFGEPQTLVNSATGEKIEVVPTTLTGADTDFAKFWIGNILSVVDELSNAKMKVVFYILTNVNRHTNTLLQTINQIAAGSGVSFRSALRTLQVLEEHDIIRRRFSAAKHASSIVQLNPNVLMTGPSGKRRALLFQFEQLDLPLQETKRSKVVSLQSRRKKKAS